MYGTFGEVSGANQSNLVVKDSLKHLAEEKRSTDESNALHIEELEFKKQQLELELDTLRSVLKRSESDSLGRITQLEDELEAVRSDSRDKEQNLSSQAHSRFEEIKRLNAHITELEKEKYEALSLLSSEKQLNQLAAKQAEVRQRQHASEIAKLEAGLEELRRESSQTTDVLLR